MGYDLSSFITLICGFFGDFHFDSETDKAKADMLLDWADTPFLTLYTPLRLDRIIDFCSTSGSFSYRYNSQKNNKPSHLLSERKQSFRRRYFSSTVED